MLASNGGEKGLWQSYLSNRWHFHSEEKRENISSQGLKRKVRIISVFRKLPWFTGKISQLYLTPSLHLAKLISLSSGHTSINPPLPGQGGCSYSPASSPGACEGADHQSILKFNVPVLMDIPCDSGHVTASGLKSVLRFPVRHAIHSLFPQMG